LEPESRRIIAGARAPGGSSGRLEFADTAQQMFQGKVRKGFGATNTTLVVVMTNAKLQKLGATKIAEMAQDGMARAISPVHTQFDGDLVFTLALGKRSADLTALGTAAAEVTARSIVRAVRTAKSLGGVKAVGDGSA
jgi:L-aminopeptidase/D-esterase-like protein